LIFGLHKGYWNKIVQQYTLQTDFTDYRLIQSNTICWCTAKKNIVLVIKRDRLFRSGCISYGSIGRISFVCNDWCKQSTAYEWLSRKHVERSPMNLNYRRCKSLLRHNSLLSRPISYRELHENETLVRSSCVDYHDYIIQRNLCWMLNWYPLWESFTAIKHILSWKTAAHKIFRGIYPPYLFTVSFL